MTTPDSSARADEALACECGVMHQMGVFCDRPIGHKGEHQALHGTADALSWWPAPAAPREEPRAEPLSEAEPRMSPAAEGLLARIVADPMGYSPGTLYTEVARFIVTLRTALASARSALDAKDAELCDERSIAKESIRVLRENLEAAQSALDEAKRDTERLDWIDRSALYPATELGSLRAWVDAARAVSRGEADNG